ncbi:hypothetical protein COFR110785_10395 [Corynebacterium frankenforstense]
MPVRDHLGRPAAAITVTHPLDSLDQARAAVFGAR